MKRYLVEVRLGYDVRADTADEALKLVSLEMTRQATNTQRVLCSTDGVAINDVS
jgi:hypothetical protein